MSKCRSKSSLPFDLEWSTAIAELRHQFKLCQAEFAKKFHSSAMAVSRWERGVQEPTPGSYIELGNLTGDPNSWYFWGRARWRYEDLMRVVPQVRRRLSENNATNFQIVRADSGGKKLATHKLQLVAIPLLKIVAASHGGKGENKAMLYGAPVESMIAAPKVR